MRKTLSIYSILLIIALISAGVGAVGAVSAKDATVGTVTNVPNGTVIPVNITIHSANKMDAFGFHVEFDPDVIKVTRSLKRVDGWSITGSLEDPGKYKIGGYSEEPDAVLTGDFLLCDLMCQALTNDGSKTNITLVFDTIYEQKKNVAQDYKSVNGTFSTLDEVPPTITIDYPRDTATVSQDIMVNATITDVGGVNPDSIKVYVGNTAVTFDKATIPQGCIINATHTVQNLGQHVICVEASDKSGRPNNSSITVDVQQSGITITYPTANDQFINNCRPAVSANFVEVDPDTVRMFLDGKNVTGDCTIDKQLGTITLGYGTNYLDDKKYEVVISGTSPLTHSPVSSNASFVIDTTPPIVTIDCIDDSDSDGFWEAGEWLYVHYTADDPYLKEVWFGDGCNTSSSGIIKVKVPIGNLEMAAYARDLAGNVGNSTPVHIYNNNLVYFNDSSLGSFAGLDLTKTALYDVFSTAKAFTLFVPNAQMTAPTLGRLDKTLTGGSNVIIDCRKNDPIPAGTLPSSIGIYTTPAGTLDFAVSVPNVTNATLMIARANSTLIDQLISNPSKDALAPGMLKDLLDSKKIVLYGKEGYAIVNVDTRDVKTNEGGSITVNLDDMSETIRINYVDLSTSTGFNTKNMPYGSTPLQISDLGQGEYALLAVCMDDDRFAIVAATTFTVTKEAGLLSTSAATYTIGQPVVVNSAKSGEILSAVVLNSAATYTGNVTLDFSTLGKDTFKSAYLLASGNQTVVKPFGQANLWLTKGYGNASAAKNANSVSIPTFDLLPGTYRVYMFLEDKGNVTSYNEATITLTTVTPTPAPYTPGRSSGGGSGSTTASYTGTGTLLTGSSGTVLKSIIVNANDNVGNVFVPIGTKALDADGRPLSGVSISPLTESNVPAVPSGSVFRFAGYAYEAGPDGATFSPGITLSLNIPEDVWKTLDPNSNKLTMKWYNKETGLWEDVQTTVIPGTRTVEIRITHFSIYALFTEPVTTVTPIETATTTTTTTPTTPSGDQPAEGLPMMMIIAIFAVLVIVIAAGYFFMMRK